MLNKRQQLKQFNQTIYLLTTTLNGNMLSWIPRSIQWTIKVYQMIQIYYLVLRINRNIWTIRTKTFKRKFRRIKMIIRMFRSWQMKSCYNNTKLRRWMKSLQVSTHLQRLSHSKKNYLKIHLKGDFKKLKWVISRPVAQIKT